MKSIPITIFLINIIKIIQELINKQQAMLMQECPS